MITAAELKSIWTPAHIKHFREEREAASERSYQEKLRSEVQAVGQDRIDAAIKAHLTNIEKALRDFPWPGCYKADIRIKDGLYTVHKGIVDALTAAGFECDLDYNFCYGHETRYDLKLTWPTHLTT